MTQAIKLQRSIGHAAQKIRKCVPSIYWSHETWIAVVSVGYVGLSLLRVQLERLYKRLPEITVLVMVESNKLGLFVSNEPLVLMSLCVASALSSLFIVNCVLLEKVYHRSAPSALQLASRGAKRFADSGMRNEMV